MEVQAAKFLLLLRRFLENGLALGESVFDGLAFASAGIGHCRRIFHDDLRDVGIFGSGLFRCFVPTLFGSNSKIGDGDGFVGFINDVGSVPIASEIFLESRKSFRSLHKIGSGVECVDKFSVTKGLRRVREESLAVTESLVELQEFLDLTNMNNDTMVVAGILKSIFGKSDAMKIRMFDTVKHSEYEVVE